MNTEQLSKGMETEVQYFFSVYSGWVLSSSQTTLCLLHDNVYIFILAAASPPFTLLLIRSRPGPQSHLSPVRYTWQGPEGLTEWNSEWLIPQLASWQYLKFYEQLMGLIHQCKALWYKNAQTWCLLSNKGCCKTIYLWGSQAWHQRKRSLPLPQYHLRVFGPMSECFLISIFLS